MTTTEHSETHACVPVDGVEWCHVHHGIRNEDESGHCDMYDREEDGDCILHPIAYLPGVSDVVEAER